MSSTYLIDSEAPGSCGITAALDRDMMDSYSYGIREVMVEALRIARKVGVAESQQVSIEAVQRSRQRFGLARTFSSHPNGSDVVKGTAEIRPERTAATEPCP